MKRFFTAALLPALCAAISFTSLSTPSAQAAGAPICRDALSPKTEGLRKEIQAAYRDLKTGESWWKSHLLYRQHLQVTAKFAAEVESRAAEANPELQDPRFLNLLKRTIQKPQEELTVDDLALLHSSESRQRTFVNTLKVLAATESSVRLVQRFSQYWSVRASNADFLTHDSIAKKSLATLQAIYNGPLRFLIPSPLPRWNTETDRIFEAQAKAQSFQPSPQQLAILEKHGASEVFEERSRFIKERPTWTTFRRWVRNAYVSLIVVNTALVANLGMHLAPEKAFVSSTQFFAEPAHRLENNQVRIYNESVPFPHMAIEIDGKVYSYGQTHLHVSLTRDYLLAEKIADLQKDPAAEKAEPNLLAKSFSATGLNQLPRSVQMVTLNLNEKQKSELKRKLELATLKRYRNNTLVMDCATMIVQALRDAGAASIPQLIDASPSSVIFYLAALKTLGVKNQEGEPLVGELAQVAMSSSDRPQMHLLRNLYINAMEAKIHWLFKPIHAPQRLYLDLVHGAEGRQYWEEETLKGFNSFLTEVSQEMETHPLNEQMDVFRAHAKRLSEVTKDLRDNLWTADRKQMTAVLNSFVESEQKRLRERINSPDTSFADVLRSARQLDWLEIAQRHVIATAYEQAMGQRTPRTAESILENLKTHQAK